ncbi:hypothetical protein OQA88_4512 [Cercophora sp. LCS_1]
MATKSLPLPSQSNSNAPQRIPSFVGLPPIRRASTFGSSLLSLDSPGGISPESDSQPPPLPSGPPPRSSSPPPPMAAHPGQLPGAAQGPPMFMTGPPPPGQQVQNIYRPTPTHPTANGPPRTFPGGPPNQPMVNGAGPQGNQGNQGSHPPFAAPGMGGRPGMVPPHMMNHHLQRLPPQAQGGWVVQESHLSEPLQQSNRHRTSPSNSSQQPFYGYDKEAGVPETTGLGGDNERDDDDDDSITQVRPPSQTNGPPQLNIGQALTSNKPAAAPQQAPISPPSRSNTGDLQTPSPVFGADEARGRRQSSIFTSIKGKLSGNGSGTSPVSDEGRRGSFGLKSADGVEGDSDGPGSLAKRLPFSRLRNAENASDEVPSGSQDSIIAHSSGTPMPLPDVPSPFPPPEKKKSFFGNGPTPTLRKERTDLSMDSPNGSGKKGFSALLGKFRPGNANGVESPKENRPPGGVPGGFMNGPPPSANGAPSSVNGPSPGLGQPPAGPGPDESSQSSLAAPPPAVMRGRSDSTSSGFSFQPSQTSQASLPQQQLTGDVDKKRNVSGGMFGFGKLKKSDVQLPPTGAGPQRPPSFGQGPPGGIPSGHGPPAGAPSNLAPPTQGPPGQSPHNFGVPARVPVNQNPAGRVSFALPPSAEHPAGQIAQSLASQGQMGRGQPPSDQTPQMGRGQIPAEQERPASMGRGQLLQVQDASRPSSMGRGQGPDSRPSSMGRGQLVPGLGRGQLPAFAPSMAMGPGYGMQALGPDGKPIVLQGQFNPQTGQFVVLLPPGVAPPTGPLQNIRPIVPGSQLSLLPPLPESRPPSQHGDSPAREHVHANGHHSHAHSHSHSPLSQSVSASQKDLTKPDESTPPSSRLSQHQDSPNSQRSQPVSLEQSRHSLSTTPVQYRQSVPPPQQPGQQGGSAPQTQLPARKPVQLTDNPSPLDGPGPGGYRGHRSSSSSLGSQTQSEHARRASGPPSNRLSSQSQMPPPAPSAGQAAQLAPSQGPSPRPSMQGVPPQQLVQPAQPGAPFFAPGQVFFPPGQMNQMPPFGAAPPGGPPGQQLQQNGIPPPAVTTAIPKEKEQSTLSKLLKGTKTPTTPGTPGGEKKSFFGFRRESKQPQVPPKPAQGPPQAPPQGPPQGMPQGPPGQLPGQPPMGQPFPPPIMPLQRQMTGPQPVLMPLHPQMTGPQPLRPQMTGPQPLRPQMTGPQPLRPQMTGPQPMLVPLQPQMTGPQPGMMFPPQLMMVPQMGRGNNGEPQYAQVPIPRGYGYVHAEGGVAPAPTPYIVGLPGGGFAMPSMPVLQPGMSPQQMFPPGALRPAWAAPMPGQQMLQPQHTGTTITGAPAPLVPQPTGTTIVPEQPAVPVSAPAPVAQPDEPQQHSTPTPPAMQHSAQQTPISPQASLMSQIVSPASTTAPEGQFPHITTNGNSVTPPQLRHPGSPQGYPIPHSAFSPINPAANNPPNPPLPANLSAAPRNQSNGGLVPSRQISAVSQISLKPGGQSQGSNFSSPVSHISAAGQSSHTSSPQITPDRNVSPEPARGPSPSDVVEDSRNVSPEQPVQPFQAPTAIRMQPAQGVNGTRPYTKHTPTASAPRNSLTVQPQTPRSAGGHDENLYDATPRHSTVPLQYREPNSAEPKSPGPSQETSKPKAPSPIHEGSTGVQSTQNKALPRLAIDDMDTPPPASSTERELFERTKRQMTLRDQEEKIPVFPTEPDPMPQKKKEEEEQPQMTATSYPGQEWNPYEAGYGDWDD